MVLRLAGGLAAEGQCALLPIQGIVTHPASGSGVTKRAWSHLQKDQGQVPGVCASFRLSPSPDSLVCTRQQGCCCGGPPPTAGSAETGLSSMWPQSEGREAGCSDLGDQHLSSQWGQQKFGLFVNPGSTQMVRFGAGGATPEEMQLFLAVKLVRICIQGSLQGGRENTLKICLYAK